MTYPQPSWMPPPPPQRKIGVYVALAVVGALVIAGAAVGVTLAVTHGGQRSATAAAPASTRPRIPSSTSKTRRQNVPVQIGETVGFGFAGNTDVEITLTKITVDGKCTEEFSQKAQNGHYLFLDITAKTSPDLQPGYAAGLLNPLSFSVIGPDGITEPGEALMTFRSYGCLARGKALPSTLAAGQKYVGTIVLDSRNTTGSLVLTPVSGLVDPGSLVWQLGQGT